MSQGSALPALESEAGHASWTSGLLSPQPTATGFRADGASTEEALLPRFSHSSRLRPRRSSERHLLTPATTPTAPLPPLPPHPPSSAKVKQTDAVSPRQMRYRTNPRLPTGPAPPCGPATMYWSNAPVWGTLPNRTLRGHTATVVDCVIWVFGGCGSDLTCSNDVWCLDTDTFQWTHPEMVGDIPPPRRGHSATLVRDSIILVFGGVGGEKGLEYFNDLYTLDTFSRRWDLLRFAEDEATPQPRRGHSTINYGRRVIIFGGGSSDGPHNDLWFVDLHLGEYPHWQKVEAGDAPLPAPRGYHSVNLVGNTMVLVGGTDGRRCFNDIWMLHLDTFVWEECFPFDPYHLLAHTSVQVGIFLFLFGGNDGSRYRDDLHTLDLLTMQYTERATAGKHPSPRGHHATVLIDSRLYVIGGFDGSSTLNDVCILDLAASAYLAKVTEFTLGSSLDPDADADAEE